MPPNQKVFIWGFPGVGKSSVRSPHRIVDADCKLYQYHIPDDMKNKLHRPEGWSGLQRQTDYPQNYFDFIRNVDAEIVLLNCHLSLLKNFDQERLLLVYPSPDLKKDYLERYARRGDHISYIQHMQDSFEDMVDAVKCAPFLKYEIKDPRIYLQDLLKGDLMSQFITKQELSVLLEESIALDLFTPPTEHMGKTPATLAQLMFDGELGLDLDTLRKNLAVKKAEVEKESLYTARRGGLTHEELREKIMDGIVLGALGIEYDEISPYSHGYEVTFNSGNGPIGSTRQFKNRWECYCDLFEVPERITCMIEKEQQDNRVFGANAQPLNIHELLQAIDDMASKQITSFTPEKETDFQRWHYPHRTGSVASVMDVHAGKGLDGIVQHHYFGTYSTMTPVRQNQLVETLVCLKGFCLDCVDRLDIGQEGRQKVIDYLKSRGTDISTPEKLQDWINANPDKCGLESNRSRKRSFASQVRSAEEKAEGSIQNQPHKAEHER